jgi:hypothetical protein
VGPLEKASLSKGPTRVGTLPFFYSPEDGDRFSLSNVFKKTRMMDNVQNINIHRSVLYLNIPHGYVET